MPNRKKTLDLETRKRVFSTYKTLFWHTEHAKTRHLHEIIALMTRFTRGTPGLQRSQINTDALTVLSLLKDGIFSHPRNHEPFKPKLTTSAAKDHPTTAPQGKENQKVEEMGKDNDEVQIVDKVAWTIANAAKMRNSSTFATQMVSATSTSSSSTPASDTFPRTIQFHIKAETSGTPHEPRAMLQSMNQTNTAGTSNQGQTKAAQPTPFNGGEAQIPQTVPATGKKRKHKKGSNSLGKPGSSLILSNPEITQQAQARTTQVRDRVVSAPQPQTRALNNVRGPPRHAYNEPGGGHLRESIPQVIPFEAQHEMLNYVQKLTEECVFDFAKKWMPVLMTNMSWTTPLQVEISMWRDTIKEGMFPPHAIDKTAGTPLHSLLVQATHLRNAAVHRRQADVENIQRMLLSAIALVKMLRDRDRQLKLERILNELKSSLERRRQQTHAAYANFYQKRDELDDELEYHEGMIRQIEEDKRHLRSDFENERDYVDGYLQHNITSFINGMLHTGEAIGAIHGGNGPRYINSQPPHKAITGAAPGTSYLPTHNSGVQSSKLALITYPSPEYSPDSNDRAVKLLTEDATLSQGMAIPGQAFEEIVLDKSFGASTIPQRPVDETELQKSVIQDLVSKKNPAEAILGYSPAFRRTDSIESGEILEQDTPGSTLQKQQLFLKILAKQDLTGKNARSSPIHNHGEGHHRKAEEENDLSQQPFGDYLQESASQLIREMAEMSKHLPYEIVNSRSDSSSAIRLAQQQGVDMNYDQESASTLISKESDDLASSDSSMDIEPPSPQEPTKHTPNHRQVDGKALTQCCDHPLVSIDAPSDPEWDTPSNAFQRNNQISSMPSSGAGFPFNGINSYARKAPPLQQIDRNLKLSTPLRPLSSPLNFQASSNAMQASSPFLKGLQTPIESTRMGAGKLSNLKHAFGVGFQYPNSPFAKIWNVPKLQDQTISTLGKTFGQGITPPIAKENTEKFGSLIQGTPGYQQLDPSGNYPATPFTKTWQIQPPGVQQIFQLPKLPRWTFWREPSIQLEADNDTDDDDSTTYGSDDAKAHGKDLEDIPETQSLDNKNDDDEGVFRPRIFIGKRRRRLSSCGGRDAKRLKRSTGDECD